MKLIQLMLQHWLYYLICFIVLTYEVNSINATALIEWRIMHLLRSKNTFFNSEKLTFYFVQGSLDITYKTKMKLHPLFVITYTKLEIQVMKWGY